MLPKRVTYLEKRDGMPRADFRKHWSTVHADIARDLPGVAAYRQNHVATVVSAPEDGTPYRVDGIVELWFDDAGAAPAGYGSEVADRLVLDEPRFLSGLTGGPVVAPGIPDPRPHKLWLLARWRDAEAAGLPGVEAWAAGLAAELAGTPDAAVNTLVPEAELLLRDALRHEQEIPEVAVVLGFDDGEAAAAAAAHVGDRLNGLRHVLRRVHVYVAEEVVIT